MFFSFLISLLLLKFALFYFPKWGFLDRPERYGLTRKPIPYYGGIVIYLSFLISVLIFVPLQWHVVGLLIAGSMIAVLGFFDDLLGLHPFFRLFIQFLAVAVLVYFGIGILSINLPFFGVLDFNKLFFYGIPLISSLFTIFWVMAVLNTMNFVDGVPGLSSGVSFIAGLTIFFLSIHPELHADPKSQIVVASLALIIAMISLAFLLFDFPTPKILMGDTGSTFLGFMIATLAIFSGGKVATAFLVLGLPILDMVWVVLRRIYEKKPFWRGDLKHLHHRFLDFGFSQRKVVIVYLLITAFFGFTAVLLVSSQQKFFMLIGLFVLMLVLAGILTLGREKT